MRITIEQEWGTVAVEMNGPGVTLSLGPTDVKLDEFQWADLRRIAEIWDEGI